MAKTWKQTKQWISIWNYFKKKERKFLKLFGGFKSEHYQHCICSHFGKGGRKMFHISCSVICFGRQFGKIKWKWRRVNALKNHTDCLKMTLFFDLTHREVWVACSKSIWVYVHEELHNAYCITSLYPKCAIFRLTGRGQDGAGWDRWLDKMHQRL